MKFTPILFELIFFSCSQLGMVRSAQSAAFVSLSQLQVQSTFWSMNRDWAASWKNDKNAKLFQWFLRSLLKFAGFLLFSAIRLSFSCLITNIFYNLTHLCKAVLSPVLLLRSSVKRSIPRNSFAFFREERFLQYGCSRYPYDAKDDLSLLFHSIAEPPIITDPILHMTFNPYCQYKLVITADPTASLLQVSVGKTMAVLSSKEETPHGRQQN